MAGVKYWVPGWMELEKSCFHLGQASENTWTLFFLEKRVFCLLEGMKFSMGGFGEEEAGWRGEVTRYFVDREKGGKEGTGCGMGQEPRAITWLAAWFVMAGAWGVLVDGAGATWDFALLPKWLYVWRREATRVSIEPGPEVTPFLSGESSGLARRSGYPV
ncbi:hypothetical protein IMZ48_04655 [Candidatus Bathyarchaeota archaeon]|nr:hypothetical protein [Candidatus Bathyarchaeota archaeon]